MGSFSHVKSPHYRLDEEGIVTATIYPGKKWRVYFEATEWFAYSRQSTAFKVGDFVRIIGTVDATTKLIDPI